MSLHGAQYSMAEENPAAKDKKQELLPTWEVLLFDLAKGSACQYSMAEDNPAA